MYSSRLKVLYIGGTGNISSACTREALRQGHDVYHLNRGRNKDKIVGIKSIYADIHNFEQARIALQDYSFDVVVNFIAFNTEDIERDFELFKNKTKQYIFISSTSIYQKPLLNPFVNESTPLSNPFWEYARNKINAELKLNQLYRDHAFPITIVRPSLTYEYVIPLPIAWKDFTVVNRIKEGKPVVVHGDGNSLWTITHSSDFAKGLVGLFLHYQAYGQAFHITSDEVLTWNQIYEAVAAAVGCNAKIVHVASDKICEIAEKMGRESMRGTLLGDKAVSVIFDNSKIKSFVPEFKATIPFQEGIKKTIQWFENDPSRCVSNPENEKFIEELVKYSLLA